MLHVALYEPEIPPNTGNIIRLCANTGAQLHLIEPLGFDIDDKRLRRAGLDYHEFAEVKRYKNWNAFRVWAGKRRILACETGGKNSYANFPYQDEDIILMGPETRGLPATILNDLPEDCVLRIPMKANSRSINLSNATAIILYEAWRTLDFPGML